MGKGVSSSNKTKHTTTLWPSYSNPRYTPARNENIYPEVGLYKNIIAANV